VAIGIKEWKQRNKGIELLAKVEMRAEENELI